MDHVYFRITQHHKRCLVRLIQRNRQE